MSDFDDFDFGFFDKENEKFWFFKFNELGDLENKKSCNIIKFMKLMLIIIIIIFMIMLLIIIKSMIIFLLILLLEYSC